MNDDNPITRAEADAMALRFLRDNGPHTMGPIEDDSSFAAAFIFLDLCKAGLAISKKMAPGYVHFVITDEGRKAVAND